MTRRRGILGYMAVLAALLIITGCAGGVPQCERLRPPAVPTEPPHRGESIEDHVNNATRFPQVIGTPDDWAGGPKE